MCSAPQGHRGLHNAISFGKIHILKCYLVKFKTLPTYK